MNTTKRKALTNWENPPKIADLEQDRLEAQTSHNAQMVKIQEWADNMHITGKVKHKKMKGKSSITPKLIRKQAEWRYPSLTEPFLSTDEVFEVSPVTAEDKKSAEQNALVLNNQFNTKLNKLAFFDEYIRAAVDDGTVICRTGWEFEEEEQEVEVPVMGTVPVQDPTQAQQMIQQGMLPVQEAQVGVELQMQMVTTKNHPTVEVCDINNVILDPTAGGNMDNANFVIYFFETSMSELKADGRYKNLNQIIPASKSILSEPDYIPNGATDFEFKDEPRKKMVAYEYWGYWDIHGSGIVEPIVVTYIGTTIIRMEENPYPDKKLPFIITQTLFKRNSNYGEPDGELLKENQQITGAVTRGMIDIMGSQANGQSGTAKGFLDITNQRKYDRGSNYEFNPQSGGPANSIYTHEFPDIPQSAQYMLGLQQQDAESLTGVKAFSSGISGSALGSTATGIRSALDATTKRELDILRRLAEGIKQIGRKFISMNGEFLGEEEVVRITNEEFVQVRRDDLAGNFDLRIGIATAESDNEKAQELSFMLQTMGNNMDFSFSQILLTDIAKLRKMPALAAKIESFEQQPDPMAQELQALEIELKKAEIDKEVALAEEYRATAALDMAKAETERANAGKITSQKDKLDLDFLEQESGVNQERKLEEADKRHEQAVNVEYLKQQHKQQEAKKSQTGKEV